MRSRYVQKSLFVPNRSQTLPDFAFGATDTTKKIIAQLHRETVAPATPIFWRFLIQAKCRKTHFKHWRRYYTTLKPCSFNINRTKAFRLFRFTNLSDPALPHFQPRPILTCKIMKNTVFGALHPFFDIETMFLQYKPYKVTLFIEGIMFLRPHLDPATPLFHNF